MKQNGGLVVIVSPYDWNEEITPRGSWLGGYLDANGNEVRGEYNELCLQFSWESLISPDKPLIRIHITITSLD